MIGGCMTIAVCDDEKEIRASIERNIRLLCADARIIRFEDGNALLSYPGELDILFLDIQMDGMNGIEAARALRKAENPVTIIFVTALEEYVFEAFDVRAFHYLVKPIDNAKFFEVLQSAIGEHRRSRAAAAEEKAFIAVKQGSVTRRIFLCEILYLEVLNRKVTLHTAEEKLEFYGRLVELEKRLDRDFVRCHRAFIVNLRYVASYDAGSITLDNGEKIMLAKQKYTDFVKYYANWLRKLQQEHGGCYAGTD